MKIFKSMFSVMLLLMITFVLYGCPKEESDIVTAKNAYITIDINPSIEIITGEDGFVTQVNALNDDAQILLMDTNFVGKSVDEVISEIMDLAVDLGYVGLEDENAIIVTAEAGDTENTQDLENDINDTLKKFKEKKKINMSVINANNRATDELKAEAEALEISIGKLKLVKLAMMFDETLTLETGATMPVKDLNRIIIDNRNEMKDFVNEKQQKNYLALKREMHEALMIGKVQYIYEAMIGATDSDFSTVIEGTVTVEQIKNLYKAYFDELTVIKDSTNDVDLEENLNEEIQNDTEITTLLDEQEDLENEIETLQQQLRTKKQAKEVKEIKTQLRTKMEALDGNKARVRNLIQEHVNEMETEHQNINIENDNPLTFSVQEDRKHQYLEIKQKYEGLFLEMGIVLEELEDLFDDQIEQNMETIRNQYQTQIQTMKNEAKNQASQIKSKIREEKQVRKDVRGE